MKTVLVILATLVLLPSHQLGRAERGRGRDGGELPSTILHDYLRKAEEDGIINKTQLIKLYNLGEEMNFTSTFTTTTSTSSDQHTMNSNGGDDGSASGGDKRASLFLHVYYHLTLLNVLYLSGAIVIMGAYTLFMTLAMERSNYAVISVVMVIQVVVLGALGVKMWYHDDYMYPGGILCTISTGMVPFTVYHIQRALKVWPKKDPGVFMGFNQWIRPGWVVMEMATIAVGMFFYYFVRFPFLSFPISFSLWYLSMDLAPLLPRWGATWETVRIRVSMVMGVGMMCLGYLADNHLESESGLDLGFWFYFFGLLTFSASIIFEFPSSDLHGSLFLLTNLGLILLGSRLERTTFHVFGTLGIIEYCIGVYTQRIKSSNSKLLWILKTVVASSLFSLAVQRNGTIEILGGIACLLAFNFDYIIFVTSGERYALLLLAANLGFVSISGLFSRPLELWLFTLPDTQFVFSLVCSLAVITFHAKIPAKFLQSSPKNIKEHLFLTFRIFSSVAVAFVFVFLRQPHFAWVGGLGLPMIALCYSSGSRGVRLNHAQTTSTFLGLLASIVFSLFLQSNLLYLICCLFLTKFQMDTYVATNKMNTGCFYAVLLILTSILLNSKFLVTIGAIYIIFYLTYLAYHTFKDSLLFPLILILLGTVMITCAIGYQKYEEDVQARLYSMVPHALRALSSRHIRTFYHEGSRTDWILPLSKSRFTLESFSDYPFNWLLWPGALSYSLVHGPVPYLGYVWTVCMVVIVAACGWMEWRHLMMQHLEDKIKVTDMKLVLSDNPEHAGHGVVIKIEGTKPASEREPLHMALDVSEGCSFWEAAEKEFGSFGVSIARSMFLPYKLTPHLITTIGYKKGSSQFSATVLIGTGHKGSHRMKHSTLTGAMKKLAYHTSKMPIVVLYSRSWYLPWSRLCVKDVDLKEALAGIRQAQ